MDTVNLQGVDLFGEPITRGPQAPLAERFLFPPFSVLNAREGEWQERKRQWIALGIQSEMGRGDNALGFSNNDAVPLRSKFGKCLETGIGEKYGREEMNATSIFDPTLCEIAYRWWCPRDGQVIDPFAGGSVRGIVATQLGLRYWGCDLRAEQIAANQEQGARICNLNHPRWVCGDALDELERAPEADFLFSCPPYGDLERYSDDPRDLSTMDYHAFLAAYKRIILKATRRLKQDRFARFVVGDFRDDKGFYRNFHGHTVAAFEECGLRLYNDAVLVTAVGSLPVRVSSQFDKSRKLGKTHQNVLVFAKGDPRKAFA